jgi:hypothetical protein
MSKLTWKFLLSQPIMLRIESAFVAILSVLIFVGTFTYYNYDILYPILFTSIYLLLYVFSSLIIKRIQKAEEHYIGHATHLEITSKGRNKTKKVKVPWKNVHKHKLDHFFFGGYLLMKDGKRHPLYFNNRKEVQKFEKFAKKHMKKK